MIEEAFLPLDSGLSGYKPLPVSHDLDHGFVLRKRQQRMNVIRHHEPKMNPPSVAVIMDGGIPDTCVHIRSQQRFAATNLTVDGDEEDAVVNPRGHGMAKPFAAWQGRIR
jgi:hypothetical protein